MTLNEAFIHFTKSATFKKTAKVKDGPGGKYRLYLSRFKKDQLKTGAIVELLLRNGYEIKASANKKDNIVV